MAGNLYITAVEPRSGKSLAALGVMEFLSRRVGKLGFFRPIVDGGADPDNDTELIRLRYCPDKPYEALYGVTADEAKELAGSGQGDEVLKRVLKNYKQLERDCDFVLCEGTDYSGIGSNLEFEFNATVAKHLGGAVLLVTTGRLKKPEDIVVVARAARTAFVDHGCAMAAVIVNRVEPDDIQAVRESLDKGWAYSDPVFVIPERPQLNNPTVSEVARALGAEPVLDASQTVDPEVLKAKIAAMLVSNYLERIENGALVITPGDRTDIILGSLASYYSEGYPNVAGIILSGGIDPGESVTRLIEGFRRSSVPVYKVQDDTHTTAMKVKEVRSVIAPLNERKIAAALGTFEALVDTAWLESHIVQPRSARVTPLMFEYELVERAKENLRHIVLPEGEEDRIIQAAEILLRRGVVELTLLGREDEIHDRARTLGVELGDVRILDPAAAGCRGEFAQTYFEMRRHRGATEEYARDLMLDVSYFGTMMVYKGMAQGMVSGAVHTTAHTIRPSFEIIRTCPGCSLVSSVFLMCLEDRVLVYGDCAVNPNPNPRQLADIAVSSAQTAKLFGIEPRVAMLSYATGESGKGEDVDSIREATRLAREMRPDLKIEGPIQYDAAVDASVALTKMPGSDVAGQATVFIFPDLNTGNNTYKAVQRSSGAVAIGPVLQGLNRPVNDLSRGCTVTDIVNTVAITAIQAQQTGKEKK